MLTLPLAILCFILSIALKNPVVKIVSIIVTILCLLLIIKFPVHRTHVDGLEVAPVIWDRECFPMPDGQANYVGYETELSYSDRIASFNIKVYDSYGSPKMQDLPASQTTFIGIDTDKVSVHTFRLTTASRLMLVGYDRRYVIVVPTEYLRAGENTLMPFGVKMYYQKDGKLSPDLLRWIGTEDSESVVAQAEAPPKPQPK